MSVPNPSSNPPQARVPVDLRRRDDALIQVSRLTAELFWRHGVAATRGEDIAAAAGISTRTLWRYFRSKEACVEPVLAALTEQFYRVLAAWPLDQSLRTFLTSSARPGPVRFTDDQLHAMHVVHLGLTEPALRSAWLVACDDGERRCVPLVAERLGVTVEDHRAQRITAAVCAANRALNDAVTADYIADGRSPRAEDLVELIIETITNASGGALGEAVTDKSTPRA